ncbi:MAG: type II secretion system GspH family protein, partial [Planctomycetes bacterium]|nr:type II secretion system GspH family protein [Planctomycetota bacterium]
MIKLFELRKSARNKGFTLLEMMVVIMIIGILSGSLIVLVPEMVDKANMTANEKNMSRIYEFMIAYRMEHNQAWPKDDGQRFFLR